MSDLALHLLVRVVVAALDVASRFVPRLRRQLTRDLRFEIGTIHGRSVGVEIDATRRRIRRVAGAGRADCRLAFDSGWTGIRALLATDTAGRIVRGMNANRIQVDGNPVLVLWFHGLTRVVVPIGRTRRPRQPIEIPERLPEHDASWSRFITREPAVAGLDPAWTTAWAARREMWQVRGPAGERLPGA